MILFDEFRQDCRTGKQSASFHAQNIITASTSCPTIPIDEWVNVVKPPKNKGGEGHSIDLFPVSIHDIDKIVHQGLDAIMGRWVMLTCGNIARPILACLDMEAGDRMEV
jgi:hypothetical protein